MVCAQLRYLRFGEPQLNVKIRFFLRRNTFFNRKSPLRIGSPNANNKVVHRPRSQSPLTCCIKEHVANSLGKKFPSAQRLLSASPARALAAGLPRQDHVYKTTNESFCFHNKNSNKMRCKLDSTENGVRLRNAQPHLKSTVFFDVWKKSVY